MTLRIDSLSRGCFSDRALSFFGGQREEDLFQAHAHRTQFEQSPAAGDYRSRELAADVVSALTLDLEPDGTLASIRFNHAGHAGHAAQRRSGISAARVH